MGFSEKIKKMLEDTEKLQKEMQQEQGQGQKEAPSIVDREETPEGCEMYNILTEAAAKYLEENKEGRTVIILANDDNVPQTLSLVAGRGEHVLETLAHFALDERTGFIFDKVAGLKSKLSKLDNSLDENLKTVDNLIKVLKQLQEIKL